MAETTVKPTPAELWAEASQLKATEFFSHEFVVQLTSPSRSVVKRIVQAVTTATQQVPDMTVASFVAAHTRASGTAIRVRSLPGIKGKAESIVIGMLARVGFRHPELPAALSPEASAFLKKLTE